MRAWIVVALLATAFTYVPTAAAHQCTGSNCGPCTEGEFHQHTDSAGKVCQTGAGYSQNVDENGASQSIPLGAPVVALGLVAAAFVARRR